MTATTARKSPAKRQLGNATVTNPDTNPDKLMFPAAGFTKAAVVDYYVRVAPVFLPHLRQRPLTLKRYPDGVSGPFFYEKDAPSCSRPPSTRSSAMCELMSGRSSRLC
jgi:DNA primase